MQDEAWYQTPAFITEFSREHTEDKRRHSCENRDFEVNQSEKYGNNKHCIGTTNSAKHDIPCKGTSHHRLYKPAKDYFFLNGRANSKEQQRFPIGQDEPR